MAQADPTERNPGFPGGKQTSCRFLAFKKWSLTRKIKLLSKQSRLVSEMCTRIYGPCSLSDTTCLFLISIHARVSPCYLQLACVRKSRHTSQQWPSNCVPGPVHPHHLETCSNTSARPTPDMQWESPGPAACISEAFAQVWGPLQERRMPQRGLSPKGQQILPGWRKRPFYRLGA